jgi:hypothetical protein
MRTWLQTTASSQLLGRLAASGEPISHATLDALPAGHDECYVRALLVRTNVLPPRQESLDRISPWLDRLLAERPPRHVQLLQPYVQWELLRKARRRSARARSVDCHALKIGQTCSPNFPTHHLQADLRTGPKGFAREAVRMVKWHCDQP